MSKGSVQMTLKIKYPGSSSLKTFNKVSVRTAGEKIKESLEDMTVAVKGMALSEYADTQTERTLFLAAVFFQRVVSRTPVDENYHYIDKSGHERLHEKDSNVIRRDWTVSYNGKSITAGQLIDDGLSFDKFNDNSEIQLIYRKFRGRFFQKNKPIKSINIENMNDHFEDLEYGKYGTSTGNRAIDGEHPHGTQGGYSVQAPYGMLRMTEAQFESAAMNMSTEDMRRSYVSRSQRMRKIPSESAVKRIKNSVAGKKYFTTDDAVAIAAAIEGGR